MTFKSRVSRGQRAHYSLTIHKPSHGAQVPEHFLQGVQNIYIMNDSFLWSSCGVRLNKSGVWDNLHGQVVYASGCRGALPAAWK